MEKYSAKLNTIQKKIFRKQEIRQFPKFDTYDNLLNDKNERIDYSIKSYSIGYNETLKKRGERDSSSHHSQKFIRVG